MKEVILIPEERIKILNKEITNEIENKLNVKISIVDNSVEIDGEGIELYQAKNIIKAIGRGFSPEKAFRLFDEDQQFEIIDLKEHTDKKIKIIKARVIGTKGKTRRIIERKCECSVSIYGRTISLIGDYEEIKKAKEVIEMLIRGAKHSRIYKILFE